MQFHVLTENDLESVLDLFCECFVSDHYYQQMFTNYDDILVAMRNAFRNSVLFCINKGVSIGVVDNGKIIAFALLFDYNKTRNLKKTSFDEIFGIHDGEELPYYDALHHNIENLQGAVLYLLSIAVSEKYRNCGLASALIDYILEHYNEYNIVSDVSNKMSLGIYEKRSFEIKTIEDKYYYIEHRRNTPFSKVSFSDKIRLLVPDIKTLDFYSINYTVNKNKHYIIGYEKKYSSNISCFMKNANEVAFGALVSVEYTELLKYQRLLNTAHVLEHTCGDLLFYEHKIGYAEPPLYNSTLTDMIKVRTLEWSLIPDVFVSVPVQYIDMTPFANLVTDDVAQSLLVDMDFRTHYEAGVPSAMDRVDDLANLKKRIRRLYLGKVKIQISKEITSDNYTDIGEAIGPSAFVDIYISIDTGSNCAVLTWYSLSSPFLVSHLFDNIIRNQIMVIDKASCVNFYDYIKAKYNLIKCGTPKIFSVFPCDRKKITKNQLASLLVGETIYPDGENFGEIIDEDILSIVQSDHGMGQYDRAFVYTYSNSVLQFSENFCSSILDRLCEESITLFYMELILFEEAAIHIADREIINLFTFSSAVDPVDFLSKVDTIYDGYSKTIDFWDIKVNYPTSQKSITMLRKSFRIKEQLEEMQRNQEHLQTVFDTKCDIIDRKDSRRMDTSLAIISILAIFSAWIDGYDYIATWNDIISQNAIHILQRILFVIVFVTAGYAITHLFGSKIGLLLRKHHERNRRRKKRKR